MRPAESVNLPPEMVCVFWGIPARIRSRRGRVVVTGVRLEESLLSDSWPWDDIDCEAVGA